MIKIDNNRCYGCTACKSVCSQKCITMEKNSQGFYLPIVDETNCIDCGMCDFVCPIDKNDLFQKALAVYAIKDKNKETRFLSASGGAFTLISNLFLNEDSKVYGAIFDEDMSVVHIGTSKAEKRNLMRGSKYVQSDMGNVIEDIKSDISKNKKVLFTGTPCQVAAVKNVIKSDLLYTCDIICHGVSSPLIFSEYILFLEKRYGKIKSLTFRNKEKSWRGCNIKIQTTNGTYQNNKYLDVYKKIYYGNCANRISCSKCDFAKEERVSDITIGDFWGIENFNPSFDDKCGVSMLMINNKRGENIFNQIMNECDWIIADLSFAKQPQLHEPTKYQPLSDKFWDDYYKKGFKYIANKYGDCGFVSQSKILIKGMLCKFIANK